MLYIDSRASILSLRLLSRPSSFSLSLSFHFISSHPHLSLSLSCFHFLTESRSLTHFLVKSFPLKWWERQVLRQEWINHYPLFRGRERDDFKTWNNIEKEYFLSLSIPDLSHLFQYFSSSASKSKLDAVLIIPLFGKKEGEKKVEPNANNLGPALDTFSSWLECSWQSNLQPLIREENITELKVRFQLFFSLFLSLFDSVSSSFLEMTREEEAEERGKKREKWRKNRLDCDVDEKRNIEVLLLSISSTFWYIRLIHTVGCFFLRTRKKELSSHEVSNCDLGCGKEEEKKQKREEEERERRKSVHRWSISERVTGSRWNEAISLHQLLN